MFERVLTRKSNEINKCILFYILESRTYNFFQCVFEFKSGEFSYMNLKSVAKC